MNLALSDYQDVGRAFGAEVCGRNPGGFEAAAVEGKNAVRQGKPYIINAIIGKTEFRKGSVSM